MPLAVRFIASLLCLAALVGCSSPPIEEPWPEHVAKIEQMRLLKPYTVKLPAIPRQGKLRGPTVLRVHVDTKGGVRRTRLFESSGSSDHDEAAIHAMREARFQPLTYGGAPMEVTLVLPIHWPEPKDVKGR